MPTSAQDALDPDNPGQDHTPATDGSPRVVVVGTLTADAIVRIRSGGDGLGHPVLALELREAGPYPRTVRAAQVYPITDRAKAEARAAQLRKGMRVTLHSSLLNAHLSLPSVQLIESHPATSS